MMAFLSRITWEIYVSDLWVIVLWMLAMVVLWGTAGAYCREKYPRFWRFLNLFCAVCALAAILFMTVMRHDEDYQAPNWIPFSFIKEAETNREILRSMLMNVFLFVPFGMAVPFVFRKFGLPVTWFLSALLSAGVEYAQFTYHLGKAETDDILSNVLGAVIGSLAFVIASKKALCPALSPPESDAPSFDVPVFLLALAAVCRSTGFASAVLGPWLSAAVPCLFAVTAFVFFRGYSSAERGEKKKKLAAFVKKAVLLYLFWLIVFLPMLIGRRIEISGKLTLSGCAVFVKNIFFGDTFGGSWFIAALVIGTVLIALASERLNGTQLLLLCLAIYIPVCLRSGYAFLYKDIPAIRKFTELYDRIFYAPWNSFPAGLFWIACGKWAAENKKKIRRPALFAVLVLSGIGLFFEWALLKTKTRALAFDGCLCLIPFGVALFLLICGSGRSANPVSGILRKAGVVFFVSHGSLIPLIRKLARHSDPMHAGKMLLAALAACLLLSYVLLLFEKLKPFRFLRISFAGDIKEKRMENL